MIISRDQLLKAIELRQITMFIPELGGDVTYRELTGQERLDANQAAIAPPADEDRPDNDMYRAHVVFFGLIEPQLTPDDVFALQKGRFLIVNDLANRILSLSEALPGDMKSGSPEVNDEQPDAHGSTAAAGDPDAQAESVAA